MKETIKILAKYLSKYKKEVIKAGLVSIIIAILEIINPYIFGDLVNKILKSEKVNNGLILQSFLAISLIVIIIIILRRYLDFRKTRIAGLCEKDMALDIHKHIIRLPKAFHDNKKNGEIIETISLARWNIHGIINQTIFSTIPEFITVVLIMIASLAINYILTITIFAIVIMLTYVSQLKSDELIDAEKKYMNSRKDAAAYVDDAIRNIETIKTYGRENEIQKNYEQKYDNIYKTFDSVIGLAVNIQSIHLLILGMGLPIIFIVSSYLLAQESITTGQFVTILLFAGLILKPFHTLAASYITIKRSMISIKEANLLLINQKTEVYDKGIIPQKSINGEIEFRDVSFSYSNGGKHTLTNLSFKVSPGEKAAIVGSSGGGKTTMFNLLLRNHEFQGKILLDGMNIADLNLSFVRECFAVVPQEIKLFNDSVFNNIRIGNFEAAEEEVIQAAKLAQVDEFVRDYANGYYYVVNEREANLSTGQKQRIAIARAILKNAPIVILDEPTSALDAILEEEIAKLLKGPFAGKTVIVVSHRNKPLEYVDRVLELRGGKIIELKNKAEIVQI